MKITIFANGVSNGGAEHVACNLANYFVTHGYEVDLLTMADDEPTYDLEKNVNRIILLKKEERKFFLWNSLKRIGRIIRYSRYSKTNCYIAIMQIAWISLLLLRRSIQQPIIVTERSDPHRYSKPLVWVLKRLLHRADACVFQTKGQYDFYKNWLKNCRGIHIPNAISVNSEPTEWEKRDNKVVAVGRLHEVKNYPMLIRAFACAIEESEDYTLLIYGEGSERNSLLNLIKELKMEEKIELCGYARDVSEQIKKAKIYVLSSNHEGMPNALIEAMSLGVACISTDCEAGAPREIINDRNGILIPVGDEQALCHELKSLMNDDGRARTIADNAVEIKSTYAEDEIYSKWEKLVLSLIDRKVE